MGAADLMGFVFSGFSVSNKPPCTLSDSIMHLCPTTGWTPLDTVILMSAQAAVWALLTTTELIVDSARLVPSRTHIGETTLTHSDVAKCDEQAVRHAPVLVKDGDGKSLLEGQTDGDGNFHGDVTNDELMASSGQLLVVVNGGSASDATELTGLRDRMIAQRAAAQAAERRAAEERQRAEEERRQAEAEVSSGRCTQAHFDQVQAALGRVQFLFGAMNDVGFKLLTTDTVVAQSDGTAGTMTYTGNGELHVYAAGTSRFTLELRDPNGYVISGGSPWERLVMTTGLNTESRAFQGRPGTYSVKVRGNGCVLLMYYLKYM